MSARGISTQPPENQVLGPKLTYDPSWTGPLNVKRSTTNPWMLIPFILVFLNWIGVTCYAFANGDLNNDIWSHARRALRSERWIIVGTWIFAVFLTLIFFAFLRIATKLTIYALNLLFLIVAILSAYWYIQSINKKGTNYHHIIALAALIIMLIIILRSSFVNRRFIPKASEIIPETIKALIFFPSLILYLLPLYALALVTTALSVAVSACLLRIDQKFETPFGLYCHLSNFLGCIWLTLVYFAFYRVAISGTYGTWYWTRDKQEVPKFTPMRFIWITLRYHLGSVIAGSFLTHIGKFIAAMGLSHATYAEPIIDGRNEYMQVEKFYQRCYNYTGRISDLVYVYTALRGQGYCESAKNSFQIWRRNHTKFAAIDQLVRELIFMGFITISSLSMVVYAGLKFTVCARTSLTALLFVFFFIYFAINSILLLLEVAMDTIFICGLEDFEVNGNSARPYYMSDKLKKIILENRME